MFTIGQTGIEKFIVFFDSNGRNTIFSRMGKFFK